MFLHKAFSPYIFTGDRTNLATPKTSVGC